MNINVINMLLRGKNIWKPVKIKVSTLYMRENKSLIYKRVRKKKNDSLFIY